MPPRRLARRKARVSCGRRQRCIGLQHGYTWSQPGHHMRRYAMVSCGRRQGRGAVRLNHVRCSATWQGKRQACGGLRSI
eukprot:scaffold52448_cov60-Phaeocystis_antarctica.AAC.5